MGTELVICELNIATKLKVQENITKNCQYYSIISCRKVYNSNSHYKFSIFIPLSKLLKVHEKVTANQ